MKKILNIAILLSVILYSSAQDPTTAQKKSAGAKVYELFAKYSDYSSLKDKQTGAVNDSSLKHFADLFLPGAKIHDDLNDADAADNTLSTTDKTISEYLQDTKKQFPKGLSTKITKASISFANLAQKEVKIIYEKSANASTITSPVKTYKNLDTLLMTVKIGDDYNSASISSISLIAGRLQGPPPGCPNDDDCDGVANDKDNCPNEKGIASNNGCPAGKCPNDDDCDKVPNNADKCPNEKGPASNKGCPEVVAIVEKCPNDDDCDGVPNYSDDCPNKKGTVENNGCPGKPKEPKQPKEPSSTSAVGLALSINLGFGANINSTGAASPTSLGYTNSETINNGSLTNKAGAGVNVGVEFDVLFGKQQNLGISTGVMIAANFANTSTTDFQVKYQAQDARGNNFKRLLTANELTEKVTFTNIGIPILFKFRTPTSDTKKVGFSAEFGPIISVSATGKSKITGNIDYEAIYNTQGGTLGYSGTDSKSDWLLTKAQFNKHNTESNSRYPTAANYFDQHYTAGYFVGLDQSASGSGSIKYGLGGGGMLRLGLTYQVSKSFFFNARIYTALTYNSVKADSDTFKPVDAGNDFKQSTALNSMLSTTSKLLSTQVGINLGIQYKFK